MPTAENGTRDPAVGRPALWSERTLAWPGLAVDVLLMWCVAPSRAEKPLSEVATMREGGVMKTCRPSTVMDFRARRNKSLVTGHSRS